MMFYRFSHALFSAYFRVLFRWKIYGRENIPENGPYIICANHTSWFDPPLTGCVIPSNQMVHFMAKEELFHTFLLGYLIRRLGAFPVRRDTADRRSVRLALEILQKNGVLGLFPEGTRSKTGELGEPFHGPAHIALKSKVPVLPMAILWPPRVFQPVRVNIGPLMHFDDRDKIKGKDLEEVSSSVMGEIGRLLSELKEGA